MAWFWLSFADPERPTGEQFLGVAIVEAPSLWLAGIAAAGQGVNPGGECRLWELPGEIPGFAGRLLVEKDEVQAANAALNAMLKRMTQ